jgi:NhaA family Na+:H+ antiporter
MENKASAKEWPDELKPLIRLGKRVQEEISEFMHLEISGSIVLLVAAVIAMILANSSLADQNFAVWQTKVGIKIGNFEFFETILHWVNDFLMAIFFFVVSLEIKRELIVGELSSLRRATLPLAAAGGMAAPALIYTFFNAGGPAADGWGVPMAKDIAFALGVAALLGRRIPGSLKIFIVGLGIILGLVVGKQAGITLLSFLAVKLGLANLPTGVSWKQIYGAGWLTGIGFTMSFFYLGLGF